jgi:hypothetical protein
MKNGFVDCQNMRYIHPYMPYGMVHGYSPTAESKKYQEYLKMCNYNLESFYLNSAKFAYPPMGPMN